MQSIFDIGQTNCSRYGHWNIENLRIPFAVQVFFWSNNFVNFGAGLRHVKADGHLLHWLVWSLMITTCAIGLAITTANSILEVGFECRCHTIVSQPELQQRYATVPINNYWNCFIFVLINWLLFKRNESCLMGSWKPGLPAWRACKKIANPSS